MKILSKLLFLSTLLLPTASVFAANISTVSVKISTCKISAVKLYGMTICHDRNAEMLKTLMDTLGSDVSLVANPCDADAVISIKMDQSPSDGKTISKISIEYRTHRLTNLSHEQSAGVLNWKFTEAEKHVAELIKLELNQ
jgi:hypothetical protein